MASLVRDPPLITLHETRNDNVSTLSFLIYSLKLVKFAVARYQLLGNWIYSLGRVDVIRAHGELSMSSGACQLRASLRFFSPRDLLCRALSLSIEAIGANLNREETFASEDGSISVEKFERI